MQSSTSPLRRPRPIRRAFAVVGSLVLTAGTAVNGALSAGAWLAAQDTEWARYVLALPITVQLGVFLATAAAVINRVESVVTPSSDPAAVVNGHLVPLIHDPEQLRAALDMRGGAR